MKKPLKKICEDAERYFQKGSRLERWYPVYEAMDSFLFGSSKTTSAAPHVRDSVDLKRIMITVILALLPCVIMAMWNTGYQANIAVQALGLSADWLAWCNNVSGRL